MRSPRRRRSLVALTALALCGPLAPAALAHDTSTAAGHAAEDDVVHTAAQERELQADSRADTRADSAAAAAAADGPPQVSGTWGPVQPLGAVTIHEALLPDGQILAYDSALAYDANGNELDQATEKYPDSQQNHTRAILWNPTAGTYRRIDLDGSNIFCSGLAHLVDGTVFTAGGNKNSALTGLNQTWVYNPALPQNNGFVRGADMSAERWYPTVTALPDGRMLIASGHNNGEAGDPSIPEVRATDGSIRKLTGARLDQPQYPWMDVAPDGSVVNTGPYTGMYRFDTSGNGDVDSAGDRGDGVDRLYGSHAMYDIGKVLVAGGGPRDGTSAGSTKSARIVDLNPATPKTTATASMAFARRQHNLTILADGSVLATGGNSSGADLVDKANGVYAAERWNPVTGTWTTLAAEQRTRQYHSAALLLPDGRVASSGGGICGQCDTDGYLEKNGQVFTPPYLYDSSGGLAARPVISGASSGVAYGGTLDIGTPQASAIQKVALVRLGAVTHSDNMDQRYVPLAFTRNGGGLQAKGPANANIAPPGVYMLFVLNASGVPSVAKMVNVGAPTANRAPNVAVTLPGAGAAPGSFTVTADANDPDGSIAKVAFFVDGQPVGEDTAAPYSAPVSGLGDGSHTLTAVAVDGLGAATTSPPVVVTVGAPVTPPPGGGGGGTPPTGGGGTPPTGGGGTPPTGGGTPPPKGDAPSTSLKLSRLVVLGSSSRTRKLRLTATAAAKGELLLARQKGKRLVTLKGKRKITLRKGTTVLPLSDPWNGRRLAPGRYAVEVKAAGRSARTFFTVR